MAVDLPPPDTTADAEVSAVVVLAADRDCPDDREPLLDVAADVRLDAL